MKIEYVVFLNGVYPKDIEKLKTRIENGEFNNIPSEDEEMILDEIKNTIKEFKNKEKEKDDDFER